MPLSVGDVQSEVLVEPQDALAAAQEGRNLPTHDDMQRWQQIAQRNVWDERRTAAHDFDD